MKATSFKVMLLGALVTTCDRPSPKSDQANAEVQWNGSNSGRIQGSAVAGWCAEPKVLQISLVRGDTGVAVALYPKDSLGAGVYPVVDPVRAESAPPAAGVAVRWLTQTAVQGFQGDSGRLNLQRSAAGRLSGEFQARARSVVDTQRIRLSGTFRDLPIVQDTLGCIPADTLEEADEDVDPDDTGTDETGVN